MRSVLVLLMSTGFGLAQVAPGDPAPPLSGDHWLQRADDQAVDTPEPTAFPAGKVCVVDFWATWCLPCTIGMEGMSKLREEHAAAGLEVIAVTDEPLAKAVQFLRRPSPDGSPWWRRFRTDVVADPDRSLLTSLVPVEYRNFRPFVVIVGRTGRIEWMGPGGEEAKRVTKSIVSGDWDRTAFAVEWQRGLAMQSERERIQRDEDWAAAKAHFWDDAEMLGKCAFRIASDFGNQLRDRDLGRGEEFALRAVTLTASRSAYELGALARIRHVQGRHVEAVDLAQRVLELLPADTDRSFETDNLAVYRAAAAR